MKNAARVVFLAILLLAVWLLRDGSDAPRDLPSSHPPAVAEEAPPSAATRPAVAAPTAAALPAPAPAEVQEPATVVNLHPHDEVPSLPRDDGPTPENDPIEPELPQTPAWRLEKLTHLGTLVDRQIVRLDAALAQAEGIGDAAAAERLRIRVAREKKRREAIRSEAEGIRQNVLADGEEIELSSAP